MGDRYTLKKTVNNGNIGSGNTLIKNATLLSQAQILDALQLFKQAVKQSGLAENTLEDINNALAAVEKQLQKPDPNKSIVRRKLEGIVGWLKDSGQTLEPLSQSVEMLHKMAEHITSLLGDFNLL